MKLHLPKLLCVAVMGAIALPTMGADTTYPYVQENEDGSYYMNVGFSTPGSNEESIVSYTPENGTLTVKDNDKVGAFKNNILDVDQMVTSYPDTSSTNENEYSYSNTLKINGDLEIKGTGKVILGGQPGSNVYTGIIANTVTIDKTAEGTSSSPNLDATRAHIGSLIVNGGYVQMHTNEYSGNSFIGNEVGGTTFGGLKQVVITNKLEVNGGTVVIGRADGSVNTSHYMTALGDRSDGSAYAGQMQVSSMSEGIIQSGGDLTIKGQTIAQSGLTINQTGGNMSIVNGSRLRLEGTDLTKITQNGKNADTTMTIGQIVYSSILSKSRNVGIEQLGLGTINLTNGVTYTSTTASTITQSGGGKINLSGDFSSAVFDITQSKGTINLNNGATMQSNKLALDSNALLNIAGSLTLNEGGTFEIAVNSAHDAAISIEATGSLVATAQALSLSLHEAVVSDMMDTVESATESGLLTYTIDLISSTDKSKLDTLLGQLTWEWEGLPQTAALAADTLTTVVTYDYIDSGLVVNDMGDGTYMLQAATNWNVEVTEQIPEPATATLGLLALAGLAARRRRR